LGRPFRPRTFPENLVPWNFPYKVISFFAILDHTRRDKVRGLRGIGHVLLKILLFTPKEVYYRNIINLILSTREASKDEQVPVD
jgi:hypothetical protein